MVLLEVMSCVRVQLRILGQFGVPPFAFNTKSGYFERTVKSRAIFSMKVTSIVCFAVVTTLNGICHSTCCSAETARQLGLVDPTYTMFVLFFTVVFPSVCDDFSSFSNHRRHHWNFEFHAPSRERPTASRKKYGWCYAPN